MKTLKRSAVILLEIALLLLSVILVYASNRYIPSDRAYQIVDVEDQGREDDYLCFQPSTVKAGLIFYPGGLVEYEAYSEMMEILAREGVLCIVAKMPFDLAVLSPDRALALKKLYPQVRDWYLAGHSLGGAMAARHVAKHTEEYKGLILLASYSTADLKDSGLKVLSVHGSDDQVLNQEEYDRNLVNLPADHEEFILPGGNHSQFGDYGPQKGDGKASMTRIEQLYTTCGKMLECMGLK